MSRDNIKFSDKNLCTDGEYYYNLVYDASVLRCKTDDGTVSFTYPCSTSMQSEILSLEYDQVFFWSLEQKSGGGGVIIRKWAIDSYILKQITSYTLSDGGGHTFSADDLALEHYELSVGNNNNGVGGYTYGMTDINISDTSVLSPGDILYFVRHRTPTQSKYSSSYVESAVVQQVIDSDTVRVTAAMSGDPYSDSKGFRGPSASFAASEPTPPDRIYVTKFIWLLNDYAPNDLTTAALYKINATNGSHVVQYSGSQYGSIKGASFYATYNVSGTYPNKYNTTISGDDKFLIFVNGSSLIFYNVESLTAEKSLALDNVKANLVDVWDVYDLAVAGYEPNITLYRLQGGTTYGSPLADESWSSVYSYAKTILRRTVNSIALVAEPTILPADGASTSTITAIVKDQYNNTVPAGITVSFADDSGEGRVSPTSDTTDSFGRASTTFTATDEEEDIKITATVVNGLIS